MTGAPTTADILLDAAMQQFVRHGFSKTSMADIAKAAGISRTSLYNHFPAKEDVFRALSSRMNERVYREVVAALSATAPWDRQLLDIINARVGWVYELLHASEYGRELINEKNRICGNAILAANDRFAAIVAKLLARNLTAHAESTMLAHVLIQSVNGVLQNAESKSQAEKDVTLLVDLFCKGLVSNWGR